jgi:hypothetical protein
MATVLFEKLSEHTASMKGANVVVWRIRITGSIDEYFIRADKAHSKLGGGYWADTKNLISLDKVTIPEAFSAKGYEPRMPSNYQDITCGQCGTVNSLNIDNIQKKEMQGAHNCKNKRCNSTLCIVNGIHITLKNGSKAGSVTYK